MWSTGQLGDCWEVPLTGSEVVTVDESRRNTVSYHLYVTVGEETEQATVSAAITCPDTWFFENGPDICPYEAETSYGVYERFEHGLMVWVESSDMIYIFFNNREPWPPYTIHPDPWGPGKTESDPSINPPAGMYQPVRGFGMLWRNDGDFEFDNFRERLGWATEMEKTFEVTIQCDTAEYDNTCYMSGPDSVIEMLPGRSGWSGWVGGSSS